MLVVGLTGSIGMGKSTAAAMLRRMGVPLFDADRVVHRLLAPGGAAVARVEAAFPGTRDEDGGIDRKRLGGRVFGDREALARLEGILHPMVAEAEKRFLAQARARREPLAVLDIPLLYESRGAARCDYVIVVSAPAMLQRQRVLRRPGMTEDRFAAILKQQMPDAEKRRRADFVVPTGLDRGLSLRRLRDIVATLRQQKRPLRKRVGKTLRRRGGGRMMREIVLDTETTGLDPTVGHRIIEIACVELLHHVPTGRDFHRYVNPGRDIPDDAHAVHGLTEEFLAAHPPFEAIVDEFLAFIGSDPLVIHNAEFDLGVLER